MELDYLENFIREVGKSDNALAAEDWYKELHRDVKATRCTLDGQEQKYDAALSSCKASIEGYEGIAHRELNIANSQYFLGAAEMSVGGLEPAEGHLRDAKRFYDHDNPKGRNLINANLGVLLLHVGKGSEGCNLLNQASSSARALGDEITANRISDAGKDCANEKD